MTHRIHQQLTDMADETRVRHHPLCGAHPAMDDAPCGCTEGILAALIRALIAVHAPRASASINSLNCSAHSPRTNREVLPVATYEACPRCVTTLIVVCSCWACSDYPCETVRAIADTVGLTPTAGGVNAG